MQQPVVTRMRQAVGHSARTPAARSVAPHQLLSGKRTTSARTELRGTVMGGRGREPAKALNRQRQRRRAGRHSKGAAAWGCHDGRGVERRLL